MSVQQIPRAASREWSYDGTSLSHHSGRFFRLVGAKRKGFVSQPLIDQPEIGILGFLLRERDGRREICVQAKAEPGNVALVQLAPTVQATKSNFERVHRGKATPLLQYFRKPASGTIAVDSRQSEQGTRFLGKFNRNLVVTHDVEVESETLRWFDLEQLLQLLLMDFAVNTDARSVLAVCPWGALVARPFGRWEGQGGFGEALLRSYHHEGGPCDEEIISRLSAKSAVAAEIVSLDDLADWSLVSNGLQPHDSNGQRVWHYDVSTTQREVEHWDQPLMSAHGLGHAALLVRYNDEILELAFRPRNEIGFLAGAQLGPAFQDQEAMPPSRAVCSCLNSDEGGRFYRSVSTYSLRETDGAASNEHPELLWMPLGQIRRLIRREGVFSNEARSLISLLLAYL